MRTKKEALTEQRNAILAEIDALQTRAEFLRITIEETPADAPSGEYEPGMFKELCDHLEATGRKDAERAKGLYE